MSNDYQPIKGQGNVGDFVLENQTVASDQGFSHVSQTWYDKCLTYEQGLEAMAKDKANRRDIICELDEVQPVLNDQGKICLEFPNGRQFLFDEYSLLQMCGKLGVSSTTLMEFFRRDDRLAHENLQFVFTNEFMRKKAENAKKTGKRAEKTKLLFRTRNEGILRAVLTESYAIVNNEWFMDVIKECIPGGMLSHWRGDSDTIWGNVLVPDTLRHEDDSDYAGMVSISNCEIGKRRIDCLPSVYRAICMNGNIWDRTYGKRINQVHRGKIVLESLRRNIMSCIQQQLKLLPQKIELLLDSKKLATDCSYVPVLAQTALDMKLNVAQGKMLTKGFLAETTSDRKVTLFSVVQAITRASQLMANADWYTLDVNSARMIDEGEAGWNKLIAKAKTLSRDEAQAALGIGV